MVCCISSNVPLWLPKLRLGGWTNCMRTLALITKATAISGKSWGNCPAQNQNVSLTSENSSLSICILKTQSWRLCLKLKVINLVDLIYSFTFLSKPYALHPAVPLTKFFNICLAMTTISHCWESVRVKPIPPPKKNLLSIDLQLALQLL